jgi:hypothetical protein
MGNLGSVWPIVTSAIEEPISPLPWLAPAALSSFLRCLLTRWLIRACRVGFRISPLFASGERVAETLFLSLAEHAAGAPVFLDIPEVNPYAVSLVKRYNMEKVFETARMYTGEAPVLPLDQIFGVTSFELG